MLRSPDRLRTVRRVLLTLGGSITVTDAVEAWFGGEVIDPYNEATLALDDGPPRRSEPCLLRWASGSIGPGVLAPTRPSERVESGSRTYETLGLPRKLHNGRREVGVEVAVLSIDVLYPHVAPLQEQGGDSVLPEVRFAVWEEDRVRTDRGQYATYMAEAPVEFASALLVKNRQLILNGTIFRIVDPYISVRVPRVMMILRGSR